MSSVVRSIRIAPDVDNILQREANDRNMSVNSLTSSILKKYVEWDRFSEKLNFITIAHETFKFSLESVEDEKLITKAQELGKLLPKEISLFLFKRLDLDSLIKLISLYSKYSGLARIEIEEKREELMILYHHLLGQKWSLFLKHFIGAWIEQVIGTIPECEISKSEAIFRFKVS